MYESEIAHFREQQALQDEAARQAMQGLAMTARHDFINARMHRGAERILCLFQEGKTDEAIAIMATPLWEMEGEGNACHTTTTP